REMMRCSQQWRHLKTLKWQGFGYGPFREPGPGELALFCLVCPQVGVNLPDNWEEEAERCEVFSLHLTPPSHLP
ncbi:hypothetical protein JAAARDRAFT_118041, partial [Jaapia argillacea MUCL 33604]